MHANRNKKQAEQPVAEGSKLCSDPHHEHQEDQAELGREMCAVACCDHAQAERPDHDAPKEIAEHRRQAEAADECDPER